MTLVVLFFWIAVGLLFYVYLGYPLLIWMASLLHPRSITSGGSRFDPPTVTVLVVAYNEENRIGMRIQNLLESDYPAERLQILIASDGSNDATAESARANGSRLVTVVEFAQRRGKTAVLNELIPQARGEIVVLADVRQRFESSVLRLLSAAFDDSDTGAVSGELILERSGVESEVGEGAGFYWRYEKFIRRSEGRTDSTIGCTGAIYALRQNLFKPIPEAAILDDVMIPMEIAHQGYRVRFESLARAYDVIPATASGEFTRKVRTIAGNFQLFQLQPWLLDPLRNRLWVQTISHKGLRLLSPLFLCASFGLSAALVAMPLYRYLLVVQGIFYAAALLGYALRHARRRTFLLGVPYTFCLLNAATIMAFFLLLAGKQRVTWDKPAVKGVVPMNKHQGKDSARNDRSDSRA